MENVLQNSAEILLLIFLVITFLQSGFDKIFDWKGNLTWLKGHFSSTPLKNIVPFMLATVLLFEVLAGLLCAIGLYQILFMNGDNLALIGALLSCLTLLMLLFGQRMAKDYEGAKAIVIYLIPSIFLVFLLQ